MKKLFVIISLVVSYSSLIAKPNTPNFDSSYLSKQLELQHNQRLIEINKKIQHQTDSFERELLYYKVKENYYSDALSEQANRFALIVSILFGLTLIIGLGSFWLQIKNFKQKINKKVTKQSKDFQIKLRRAESRIASSIGNTFTAQASVYLKNKKYNEALNFYLIAAREHSSATKLIKGTKMNMGSYDTYKVAVENLKIAIQCTDKLESKISLDNYEKYIQQIEGMVKHKSKEIQDCLAVLRVNLNKLLDDSKS